MYDFIVLWILSPARVLSVQNQGAGRLHDLLEALGENLLAAHLGCQQNSVL